MIFENMPTADSVGAMLAHAIGLGDRVLKKGHVIGQDDVERLLAAGIKRVMAARLEADDLGEDQAASQLAAALRASHVRLDKAFTGRVNLFAERAGVFRAEGARIDAINAIDEAITVATLPNWQAVEAGQMLATVKIIPFAVAKSALRRCLEAADGTQPVLSLSPYRTRQAALIQTILPTLKPSVADKSRDVTNRRLAALGCPPSHEIRCAHEIDALSEAIGGSLKDGAELILILGASAITDRRDVIPAAIEAQGGEIVQFGMPVDPGNLLLLARIGSVPVLGLPGCARSPKMNGFDWVLQRLMADLSVEAQDLRRMGVGGLLMEIPTRPQPREPAKAKPNGATKIAAIVLAAGQSSRMGENKLLLDDFGAPVIRRTVDHAIAAELADVIVVVGHQSQEIRAALAGRRVRIVQAPDFALGMSQSLRAGIDALAADIDGAIVMLGDMPRVTTDLLRSLVAAYRPRDGKTIVVPARDGKRGNPVLWDRRHFAAIRQLAGDVGARHLIGENADQVAEVPVEDAGVFLDVDTPQAYQHLRETPPR